MKTSQTSADVAKCHLTSYALFITKQCLFQTFFDFIFKNLDLYM